MTELPQFIIRDRETGERHPILFKERMTSQELERRITQLRCRGRVDVELVCPRERRAEGLRLIHTLWPKSSASEGSVPGPVVAQEGIETFSVRLEYFRAIAKIAFHYYLARTDFYTGREDAFKPIRDFIRHGQGRVSEFVDQIRPRIFQELVTGCTPGCLTHFLAASESRDDVFSDVLLFYGKGNPGVPYRVKLAGGKLFVAPPTVKRFSHTYSYFPNRCGNYDGEVRPNQVILLRRRDTGGVT